MSDTKLRLLFIEDSETDVELALRTLRKEGFEVSWNRVEQETGLRDALAESPPQLILSDFSMPNFDGARALVIAREMAPDIPFIFLSGTIGEERAIEAIRLGATDYVLKDNTKRLGTAVRRALDETAERQLKLASEAERARLVEVLEAASDFVSISGADKRIAYLNAAGRRLISAPELGAIDLRTDEIYPVWSRQLLEREAWPAVDKGGVWRGEVALLGGDGDEIPVSQVMVAHRGSEGDIRFYSTIARDIRDRKAYEAQIQHYANFDALTGLPNRNLLGDRVTQDIARLHRIRGSAALIVLNLDRFKLINESYGHGAGDQLLCTVAERLNDVVARGNTVARMEGDSFAVFTAVSSIGDIQAELRALRSTLSRAFVLNSQELVVTASMGASIYPRDGINFETLLRNAEASMHRAKMTGNGSFQFYAETMTRDAINRLELENELRIVLQEGKLEIHYQPQVSLVTGHMVGVEALMRWNHPTRGTISPVQFIPIAESSDLINALGQFAMNEVCRQMQSWRTQGIANLRISFNISTGHFRSPDFIETIMRALGRFDVDPTQIEVEITESVLVEDQNTVVTTLKRLKSLGLRIAIDDFGTGYSSLSYLSRLPIDSLKIDQSFVMRISEHGHDEAIAQAIISLAHALGLTVIAEGIETSAQLKFLREHRCNEGQGYLFARPLPADQILALAGNAFTLL